jgi:hypothetical protein
VESFARKIPFGVALSVITEQKILKLFRKTEMDLDISIKEILGVSDVLCDFFKNIASGIWF